MENHRHVVIKMPKGRSREYRRFPEALRGLRRETVARLVALTGDWKRP